jgi:hypothetical protein
MTSHTTPSELAVTRPDLHVLSAIYRALNEIGAPSGNNPLAIAVGAALAAYARLATHEANRTVLTEGFPLPIPGPGEEDPFLAYTSDLDALDSLGLEVMRDWSNTDVRAVFAAAAKARRA